MTSEDSCYCGARATHAGATSTHSSVGPSNIGGSLLLPPTVATGDMTSDDHCYCCARGTCMISTGTHNSDGLYDIR
jgi:hypothetical protein